MGTALVQSAIGSVIMDQVIALSSQNPLSLLMKFGMMAWNNTCGIDNCSGHGECQNGTCLCEIQFDGTECHVPNLSYYIAFATIFFVLALVCLVQLIMCIIAEWQRMKAPSFLRACRVTTQKVLYFVVFLASMIRGAYFTSPTAFKEGWSRSLLSAYYPLLLSGSSLIVCFWAEVFHLRDIHWEKPQFLSKSFLGFVIFNLITYSLLLAEFVTAQMYQQVDQSFYMHIFNGCYAVLLFIVVVFFLIYGVEVFFKVRGGFLNEHHVVSIATNSRTPEDPQSIEEDPVTAKLFEPIPSTSTDPMTIQQQVNTSQLHQSRFGLLSQAFMLFIVVAFLFSETLSEFWKMKVPLYSRNWHDIVFRVIEVGVALWFPCVLWNCMSPEQLWILNPKRILKGLDLEQSKVVKEIELQDKNESSESKTDGASIGTKDCWICYDNEREDAGPLIQPCQCRGDVSAVHHDCLRRWLVESSMNADNLACKVCGTKYNVERANRLNWQNGWTLNEWLHSIAILSIMIASSYGVWVLIQLVEGPIIKMLAAGTALLIIYVCIRFLGLNTVIAYQRAKISSLKIIAAENNNNAQVTSISLHISADPPKPETVNI